VPRWGVSIELKKGSALGCGEVWEGRWDREGGEGEGEGEEGGEWDREAGG
jgi:hypothetical protein